MEDDIKLRLELLHADLIVSLKLKHSSTLTLEQMQDLCEFFDEYLYQ